MKRNKINKYILSGVACLLLTTSCDVDPTFYSQVVPENFYTSQDAVWERFNRPFTHWRHYEAHDEQLFRLQEMGTDEFCLPTRGSDWYNGGENLKFHYHQYKEDMISIESGWTNFSMGGSPGMGCYGRLIYRRFRQTGICTGYARIDG